MSNTIYSNQIKVNCPLIHDENGYYHLIYKITNIKNGKIYIGKHTTKNPYDDYLGSGTYIKRAVKKYKPENFTKELIFCFIDEKEAFLKEEELVTQEFIERDDTYNMKTGGYGFDSGENHPNFGKSPSQETRDKLSKAMSGENNPMYGKKRKFNQETLDKMSKAQTGKKHKQETKDKISKSNTGKKHNQETKDKISKANSGENHPMYGKPGTMRGKKHKQETKDKMSKARSGENNPMYGRRGENSPNFGENGPKAKRILKIDATGNIVAEYGCMKDCREQENLSRGKLDKLIKGHTLHNGFYFEFKPKTN